MLFNREEEENCVRSMGLVGKSLAILDDDRAILELFAELYHLIGLEVQAFHFPKDMDDFWERASEFDFILLDHRLGGTNGANVASQLMNNRDVRARIFLFTGAFKFGYEDFKYYFNKSELLAHPSSIFEVEEDIVERAVETSVLKQVRITA